MDIHMVGGALTLCCLSSFGCLLFVFCLSFVCLLFVLLWLLFVFWLSFGCLVVIVCVLWVAGPGKYGMLGHGPGSPRSRGVVFGTTRKIQEDEDGGRLLIRG
jgi:membrane protein implicated in regulation of membrane protease activity